MSVIGARIDKVIIFQLKYFPRGKRRLQLIGNIEVIKRDALLVKKRCYLNSKAAAVHTAVTFF